MVTTKYSSLVDAAKQKRLNRSRISLESRDSEYISESTGHTLATRHNPLLEHIAYELHVVNGHISVDAGLFKEAASDYEMLGKQLVEKLHWPSTAISVKPQGSTNTQTLIRSPSAEKFDIDAVCAVDISVVEAREPMRFFEKIGYALKDQDVTQKKRCWKVDFPNRRHYIEFTPSVPYSQVANLVGAFGSIRFQPTTRYHETALAVVDTPSRQWKASNPEGFANWVSDQAKRPLITSLKNMFESVSMEDANVEPVPEQDVPLSDTLRTAIRLLKRHRDMCVHKGLIDGSLKPISVIIVTLLTQCYEGLADKGASYEHPIELLAELADLMPDMVESINGEYWISNPTVDGENFAEKWNDTPQLKTTFDSWFDLLREDMNSILAAKDYKSISEAIHQAFGTTAASGSTPPPPPKGLAPNSPSRPYAPPERGLA